MLIKVRSLSFWGLDQKNIEFPKKNEATSERTIEQSSLGEQTQMAKEMISPDMIDEQFFTELTPEEGAAISGGWSWNPVDWVKDGADAVADGAKAVKKAFKKVDWTKASAIGIGVGLGVLALLTGGQPIGQMNKGGVSAGGKWEW